MDQLLEWSSSVFNRRRGQTDYLFNLLNKDFGKLLLLEMCLKNNHIFNTPRNLEEVERVLQLSPEGWFKLPNIFQHNYYYQEGLKLKNAVK